MMDPKIGILVPTRNSRPTIKDLIESWKETTSGKSILIFGIDKDQEYNYNFQKIMQEGAWYNTFPTRMYLAPKLNEMASLFNYEVIGFVGDDVVFKTKEWEDQVLEWQVKNKGICYCNDLLQGENLPNNVFINKLIIDTLGWMCPPTLMHYCIDNFWKDLGIRIDRLKYFPDIIIEHKHWSNGKAEKDALYTEAEVLMGRDQKAFDHYRLGDMENDIAKILKVLNK